MSRPSSAPSRRPKSEVQRVGAESGARATDHANLAAVAREIVPVDSVRDVFAGYVYRNVLITFWFGPATMQSLEVYEQSAKVRVAQNPQGLSVVNIMVPGGQSMPTAQARSRLGQIATEHAKAVAAVVVMVPGAGFWASALRGLVTAVSMLVPRDVRFHICGSLREVAEWLPPQHRERTGIAIDAQALLRVLQAAQEAALGAGGSLYPSARP